MSEEKVLPPFVYGKLRGHLTVKVDEIFWVKSNPGNIFVELLWWGEKESHIFKPVCINQPGKIDEDDTSVTFNIRTSLLLFENYIKKSGKLILGVFKYPSREHIGDVTVWNPFKTIFSGKTEQGYYPIFNKNRLRIGDLRVSFELWMAKKDNSDSEVEKERKKNHSKNPSMKNQGVSSSSSLKDIEEKDQVDPLFEVLNRGKELRDAMTMSVLEDAPVDNIDKVIAYDNQDNPPPPKNSGSIDANKLMDFLMGKELAPNDEVLAIKTLRSVSPTQSVVNQELKTRLTSAQSCQCCFKNNNSCSSCTSRVLSSANSINYSRPQTSSSGVTNQPRTSAQNEEEMRKSKHVIELVNCYKLVIQCLHLNSLGVKKVKGVFKKQEKVKKKPGLYYMIEHLPGSQTNVDKEKPWNLKQTRFVSRKINDNEIVFGESNYLIEAINGNFTWPKVLKQLNGTSLKVYYRYHNQRLPCYLGSVIIKDDSVTPAGLFSTFTLPVNSNSGITVGHLSLLLELGHNRKTFGSHLLSCDLLKETNKDLDKDDDMTCACNGCRMATGDKYEAIWGREMERRARDMMVSCHHQCCQSACDKNPRPKMISSNERQTESRAKSVVTEINKSPRISSDESVDNRDLRKKDEVISRHDKFRLEEIPTNIPDSLKSDSSDSTSTKSDSIKNDLRLDSGNIRPRCVTTDASCQVTLDRISQTESKRENNDNIRLCKSCLAMSDYKPQSFPFNSNACNSELPNWSKTDRYYQPPCLLHRGHEHYQNHCQPFHPYHCCPAEVPTHKYSYGMTSAQLDGARHAHEHYRMKNMSSSPPIPMSRDLFSDPSEVMTIHEFSISVDRIINFPMFNQELNEEADCFVDYTFPINQNNKVIVPHRRFSTEVSMISKEVVFSTVTKHTLTLPSSQNLNHVFNSTAFPSLDFNIWCRFYRSTPVDHVIAKAILPIGRICALRQEFEEAGSLKSVKDKVCLPLLTVASPLSVQYPTKVSGSMEVTLIYKNFNPGEPPQSYSSLNSNYRPAQEKYVCDPPQDYQRESSYSGIYSSKHGSNHCCNNINYNTVQRSSSTKNSSKTEVPPSMVVVNDQPKPIKRREKMTEDRALSPIPELSNSNSSKGQMENLQKSLERMVVENNDKFKGESSKYKSDHDESDTSINAYLKKCRDLVQLESSSDEGINSIIPNVKPDMKRRKNKNPSGTNQLIEFQSTNKENSQSGSISSDNLPRIHENFDSDVNISDDDTLKSVSSVNSDDSSSHVGFIAFNKDFVKNECNTRRKKKSQEISAKMFPKVNTPSKKVSMTRCTQTQEVNSTSNKIPESRVKSGSFFRARIEVERAINLPLLAPYGSVNKQKPSSYVSFDAFVDEKPEHFSSEIVYNSSDPEWNASWNVMLPTEYLYKCDKKLVLNVMLLSHAEDGPAGACGGKNEDRIRLADDAFTGGSGTRLNLSHRPKGAVRKQAFIDLTSLCAGLRLILGWYSIVNESTPCSGQIKVKITPLEDISHHKHAWFKEYMEWEKGRHRPSSNSTSFSSAKLEELKMRKLVESIDNKKSGKSNTTVDNINVKSSSDKLPELKKTDSIDRDLVYISLNQKLSELDKIPESFKDRRTQSSDSNQPVNSQNLNGYYSDCKRKRKSSDASKDFSDLHIEKDISYVNKLLSEIPLFRSVTGNSIETSNNEVKKSDSELKDFQGKSKSSVPSTNYDLNSKYLSDGPTCSKDLKCSAVAFNSTPQNKVVPNFPSSSNFSFQKPSSSKSIKTAVSFSGISNNARSSTINTNKKISSTELKTPQDFLNSSFNASDILDLEDIKSRNTTNGRVIIETDKRDLNYNLGTSIRNEDRDDRSKTDSKSDEMNKMSNSDKIQSQYMSFSSDTTGEKIIKSGSSNLPTEFNEPCSGFESQSCVFNNKKPLRTFTETGEFRPFSPAPITLTDSDMVEQNRYQSDFRTNYASLAPADNGSDEEGNNMSKGAETLSGQSSICTDDQSMNYSEPPNAQLPPGPQNTVDSLDNLNSDLMEEASSEIDRILKELSKR